MRRARVIDEMLAAGLDTGSLMGLPVSFKDLYGIRGMPTFAGLRAQLSSKWQEQGPIAQLFDRQCALVMGKTHTPALACGGVGTNFCWDSPRNPWDAKAVRVSGGSSAGAGVSLAEGSAVLALGTDTGGSVRIPASCTGQVGLKVTHKRWPTTGIVPLSSSFDTPGVLARTVKDLSVAFAAIDSGCGNKGELLSKHATSDMTGIRLGVPAEHFWEGLDPGIGEGVTEALNELAKKGARVADFPFPEAAEAYHLITQVSAFWVEGAAFVENEMPTAETLFDETTAARFKLAREIPAVEYVTALVQFRKLSRTLHSRLSMVDVLISPTVAVSPPLLSVVNDLTENMRANRKMTRNTQPVNLLGLCAITIPIALDNSGMPVGLQLIGCADGEHQLLCIASACERILGTGRQRLGTPPLLR